MVGIPECALDSCLVNPVKGRRVHRGKVRDTYELTPELLLFLATDRLSIFDFVLPTLVPRKGEILTALTHFWLKNVFPDLPNHLAVCDLEIEKKFFNSKGIPRNALLVRRLSMVPYELIFRHHIGGSVHKEYQKTGLAAGQKIVSGLPKWSALDRPICTPSTKAQEGHDINIDLNECLIGMGPFSEKAIKMLTEAYGRAYAYAKERGILILDTKFELGVKNGDYILADEFLTPDSSRFTTVADFELAMRDGRDPIFLDKEPARNWGRTVITPFTGEDDEPIIGINKLDPANDQHVNFVHSLKVPREVIQIIMNRYLEVFEILTGCSIDDYVFD